MMPAEYEADSQPYQLGAFALLVATATILAALAFEHLGGYAPCPLCLQQRWAYYFALPALFAGMVAVSMGHDRVAGVLFGLVGLAFLVNTGLGIYQAGAEWKFWPGPESCAGGQSLATEAGSLLKQLETTTVMRCDEASWRFAGQSFAGWNAVVSLVLSATSLRAAVIAIEKKYNKFSIL